MAARVRSPVPRAHFVDRQRVWRFAALVMVFAVAVTVVEILVRPQEWVASFTTGAFPLIGAPVAWFFGPRLSPRRSYAVGQLFMLLGVASSVASIYGWRGTQIAGAMGFYLIPITVFAAAFFTRRDVIFVLALSAVASALALAADGLGIVDLLTWMPMVLAVGATGFMLASVTRTAQDLAYGDPLTGVVNRRGWEVVLTEALDRHARGGHPFSVLLADLDNFKGVNDRLGHDGGDDVLLGAVAAWQGVLRTTDTLARLGGDEFAVLLDVGYDRALEVGRRLGVAVQRGSGVTCSIGIATLERGGDPKLLMTAADEQLYAAKRAGRNRVFAISLGPHGPQTLDQLTVLDEGNRSETTAADSLTRS